MRFSWPLGCILSSDHYHKLQHLPVCHTNKQQMSEVMLVFGEHSFQIQHRERYCPSCTSITCLEPKQVHIFSCGQNAVSRLLKADPRFFFSNNFNIISQLCWTSKASFVMVVNNNMTRVTKYKVYQRTNIKSDCICWRYCRNVDFNILEQWREVNKFLSSMALDCKANCPEFIYDIFKSNRWKCKCSFFFTLCVLGQLITVT